jgi:late competence protein required for DNA uptake (superfamily II DNA/RNA helicase)
VRCANCGNTDPATLELRPNGAAYCEGCDHVTEQPAEPRLIDVPERTRRDLD